MNNQLHSNKNDRPGLLKRISNWLKICLALTVGVYALYNNVLRTHGDRKTRADQFATIRLEVKAETLSGQSEVPIGGKLPEVRNQAVDILCIGGFQMYSMHPPIYRLADDGLPHLCYGNESDSYASFAKYFEDHRGYYKSRYLCIDGFKIIKGSGGKFFSNALYQLYNTNTRLPLSCVD